MSTGLPNDMFGSYPLGGIPGYQPIRTSTQMHIEWKSEPRMVKIEWEDTTNLATWHDRNEIYEHWSSRPELCENIGYLIGEDERALYVSSRKGSFNGEEDAWGLIERIPRGVIISLVYLMEEPIGAT